MNLSQQTIAATRLYNQHILNARYSKAGDIVKWLGAVQAQDYLGSLWAIGLRLKRNMETDVEAAIANKTIVRSWPMRGTLHFVAADDLRWMLEFLTPRIIQRSAGLYKEQELDKNVFMKCRKSLTAAFLKEPQLPRNEVYSVLEAAKISTSNQRGLHILGHLAQEGFICFGPRKGKQQTFVLLDEWLPSVNSITKDEALAKLAITYFQSHGPATMHDFAWWSGLTIAESKTAINSVRSQLIEIEFDNRSYIMVAGQKIKKSISGIALLPDYDEYFVAYKDRRIGFNPKTIKKVSSSGNGIFFPVLLRDGHMYGTWKRTINKDLLSIEINSFLPLPAPEISVLKKCASKMGKFLDMTAQVNFRK